MKNNIGDFGLACALLALGYKLIAVEGEGRHKTFTFDVEFQQELFLSDIDKYYSHDLKVDPNEYYIRMRELKTRMYN